MPVTVSHEAGKWIIAGQKNRLTINETDLALNVQAGPAQWVMVPSKAGDMLVKSRGEEVSLRLAGAKTISVVPYDTGFKTGVKIHLAGWKQKSNNIELELLLTVCLQGTDEELVFDVTANEHDATLRQLDCPGALHGREVHYPSLTNARAPLFPPNCP